MSIATAISALQSASSDIASAITAKGVTVPSGSGFDDYATLISSIETGGGGTLPYDSEIAYLQGTGTQYINTGIKPDSSYKFNTIVAATVSSNNTVYWGVRNSGTSSSDNQQCYLNSNTTVSDYSTIKLYSTATTSASNWSSGITPVLNTMYAFYGCTVVSTMASFSYPITLFAFNIAGTINASFGKCRIGRWTAYSSNQKVMELIPVRVGQVGYMYDKVSKQLFGNGGSGSFTLGPDI